MSSPPSDYDFPHREAFGLRWQSSATTPLFEQAPRCRKRRGASLPAAVQNLVLPRGRLIGLATILAACWLVFAPAPAPGQLVVPWNAGPPLPFLQGPTLADTLRNGAQMASDQSRLAAQFAKDMGQRAKSPGYLTQNLWTDYQNLELQFQNLRTTFNALGELALELQSPRAANAAAELQAGLNIIAEGFAPVQQEMQAGTLNRDTILRMCQVLNEALLEWQKELKKCSARLGVIR